MISINGKSYAGGKNISIINGVVMIDGVRQDGQLSGVVELKIEGNLQSLSTDASCDVKGDVGVLQAGGSVHCGDVDGSVMAGGSVHCGNVQGSVTAGGSIKGVR